MQTFVLQKTSYISPRMFDFAATIGQRGSRQKRGSGHTPKRQYKNSNAEAEKKGEAAS